MTIVPLITSAPLITENTDLTRALLNSFSLQGKDNLMVIDKNEKRLYLYEDFYEISSFSITIGINPGNKVKSGDNRTPEGIFVVKSIENSSSWVYDYPNDTLEPIKGAYGPWFIRLNVPGFTGIGIHGFYHDNSLGKRASHGCIRLNNLDLEQIAVFVEPGMPIIILPGEKDFLANRKILDLSK